MNATAIDHVNLKIPDDGKDAALDFYCDGLGFDADDLGVYESGEKPFFSIRLSPGSVLHLWPDADFEAPTGTNYDHVAIRLDESIAEVKATLDDAGIEILDEFEPLGATGTGPAVYVEGPFGYRVELKVESTET
ncbi:VOC family protein [Halorussus gelatinilyticus]|uniref:VOC family protein n=1 Tax=Halorussus gelatinilyticus TaxID=2937524 RepID=A0A8U0IPE0_9EURY|nr:VOC family protein [Halorussus gelatinilyticus]UPW01879.1 VOC family protein [Halorussus gelatinilyticus]